MKGKAKLNFLIFVLAITTFFFLYNYLQLRQEYINIQIQEKSVLNTYLGNSVSIANKLDFVKVSAGDKGSILSLVQMYESVSDTNTALWTTFNGKIEVIDPMYTSKYTSILKDILDKAVKGELKPEDINNFKLLTSNLEVLNKYVNENDKFNSRNFRVKVLPHLKNIDLSVNRR